MTEQPGRPDPQDSSGTAGQPGRTADDALGVEMMVYPEKGRWAVDIAVIFPDGVVRRRIDTYSTKTRAEIHAKYIKRGAERDLRGPLNG